MELLPPGGRRAFPAGQAPPLKARESLAPSYADHLPKVESAEAFQAFEDYYALGPGRSVPVLVEAYQARKAAGGAVPSTSGSVIARWSASFGWVDRIMVRMLKESDMAEVRAAEELAKHKLQRLAEARGLRTIGGQVVSQILGRIKAGDLNHLPLTAPKGQPCLMVLLGEARKAIEMGGKLERLETGEDAERKFEMLIETLIQDMTPVEQAEVRAMAYQIAQQLND